MIKVENTEVFNFSGALRGMRNPLDSWDKTDSKFEETIKIGPNDLNLAQRLINSGTDHSKFMRQIGVSMDITAPLYWWKELDTYKIGTVANSCSTMHTLAKYPITADMFSFDGIFDNLVITRGVTSEYQIVMGDIINEVIYSLEHLRKRYVKTKSPTYWRALIQLLPESWNQKRTWTANYQVLRNIYFARKNHKLNEWHDFCAEIEKLPYAKELICYGVKGEEK